MARYKGPKDKLSRREGYDLFGKGAKLTRLGVPPGVHGPRGYRMRSQYAKQLREKQKVKRMYGLLEKQFKSYVDKAFASKGNTAEKLLTLLEKRLDNAVYRLGFAPTRTGARQYVTHKHITVNGKIVNIPSYQVKVGDSISISKKGLQIPAISKSLSNDATIPTWLQKKAIVGKIAKNPTLDDIPEPISTQDIIEFYSR